MAKPIEKYAKRRLRKSYLTTTISITLVLYMLGVIASIMLIAHELSVYVKENYAFTIYLHEGSQETDIVRLQKILETKAAVKFTEYKSAEEASKAYEEELGEEFTAIIGENPLPAIIELHVNATHANSDSLSVLKNDIERHAIVSDVQYPGGLINKVNANMEKIGLVLLGFSIILFLIALALINNTIRLAIFANRFIIKSMQLVGATQRFIRKPFVARSILQGLISGVLAIVLLIITFYYINQHIENLFNRNHLDLLLILSAFVILLGILISWIATIFAVRKYLRISNDLLYYF